MYFSRGTLSNFAIPPTVKTRPQTLQQEVQNGKMLLIDRRQIQTASLLSDLV